MILFTCGQKKAAASLGHPCGRAAKALDEAGYEYEIRDLPGYRLMPWTWGQRRNAREEVKQLTGQINVPVLLLDGSVICHYTLNSHELLRLIGRPPAIIPR